MEYDPVYLLVERQHNDKVGFPAQAGFTKDDSILIKQAIGRLISHNEAVVDWRAVYGVFYGVEGTLLAQEEFNAWRIDRRSHCAAVGGGCRRITAELSYAIRLRLLPHS